MSKDSQTYKKHHAVLMPLPLQGHIIPAIHLAIKLASNGFTVTFINTEANHRSITTSSSSSNSRFNIFTQAQKSGLDIRYETVSDGLPIDFDRSLNHDAFVASVHDNLPGHVETLAQKLISGDLPATCFVMDTFYAWPYEMAKKFGVPCVSFWTESALTFTLFYHVHLLKEHGHFHSPIGNRTDAITYIPGVEEISPCDLISYLQDTDQTSVVNGVIFKTFDKVRNADFILCNTVEELEFKTIQAFQLEKPFYAIGPIFPEGFTKSEVPTSLWTESDCTQWLDSKPIGSVLYISFGSYAHVSKKELEEIAYGVMESKTNFIWALRPDIISSNDPNPLHDGFLEATKGRGIVVTWCSQIEVLTHESVGGFLTHCGWNSVLESVRSEVPLLCYPLLTDQFTNRKLVVRNWGIGIDLGGSNTTVCREDVTEKIIVLMCGDEGSSMKMRIKELRKTLESATSPNGSSTKNFICQRTINHLLAALPQFLYPHSLHPPSTEPRYAATSIRQSFNRAHRLLPCHQSPLTAALPQFLYRCLLP